MTLRLPDDLRKRLVASTGAHLPLAYLVRQCLRRALDDGKGWEKDVVPSGNRPILLQLSAEERARLEMWVSRKGVDDEVAILSLIDTVV